MVAVGPAATGRTWRSEVSYSRSSGPRPGNAGIGAAGPGLHHRLRLWGKGAVSLARQPDGTQQQVG